jgi:hypothetical protein
MSAVKPALPSIKQVRDALIRAAQEVVTLKLSAKGGEGDGCPRCFGYAGQVTLESYTEEMHAVRWIDVPLDITYSTLPRSSDTPSLFEIGRLPDEASTGDTTEFKKRVNFAFSNANVLQDGTSWLNMAPDDITKCAAAVAGKGLSNEFVLRGILDLKGTKPRKGDAAADPPFHNRDSPILVVVVRKSHLAAFTAAQQALEDTATRASNDVFNFHKRKFETLNAAEAQRLAQEFNKGLAAGTQELKNCLKVCALFFFSSFFFLQST